MIQKLGNLSFPVSPRGACTTSGTMTQSKKTDLLSLLFELLDGTLVDATAFVDQVTRRRRLAGVDVADHHEVDVRLLLHLRCGRAGRTTLFPHNRASRRACVCPGQNWGFSIKISELIGG